MKLDKGFLFTMLGLFFVPPLAGAVLFSYRLDTLAVGLWVATYFAHLAVANQIGSWQGKRDMIAGARAVLEAQQVNDRSDVEKTTALAHFARVIYATKPGPAEPPALLLDGQWSEASVPQLQEFTIKEPKR